MIQFEHWLLFPALLSYLIACLSAFLVGIAKTGVPAVSLLFTALMAVAVPGKEAIALVLLLLITGDCFAVRYYRAHTDWSILKRLIPSVLVGLFIGALVLRGIPSTKIKPVLGGLILALLCVELARNLGWLNALKENRIFASFIGTSVGICTVVGNAAGPVMAIYLLLTGLNKRQFMGTSAWFFFIINLLKVPLLIIIGLMSFSTLVSALILLPFVFIGAIFGRKILNVMPEAIFTKLMLGFAAFAAVYFLWLG